MTDKNSLGFWFPKIESCGLPVPRTQIVLTPEGCELSYLIDGITPEGYDEFQREMRRAVEVIEEPCFLRTGHGSGKHDWRHTCYVKGVDALECNVASLVEWSTSVDIIGLPVGVWAVRELIPTTPLFHAFRGMMPITREFRAFVRDTKVEVVLPYWPPGAIVRPDREDWQELLAEASTIDLSEHELLSALGIQAVEAVGGGYWSVDFLQDRDGMWWLTDMADGDRSYRSTDEQPRQFDQEKYAKRLA